MKETRIFYAPRIKEGCTELPPDEAAHAVRVLRLKEGAEITLTDGEGTFYEARVTLASPKQCGFELLESRTDRKLWRGAINLAVAPTKNLDRTEWLVEKATEIGVDCISLLDCKNSERHTVKTERLEKIAVAAMKQSHKAFKPVIAPLQSFEDYMRSLPDGQLFIAHCFEPDAQEGIHLSARNFLGDLLASDGSSTVLIGPEGDFAAEEVDRALRLGFRPVSLGESRLRTETAALVAVHLMYLAKR